MSNQLVKVTMSPPIKRVLIVAYDFPPIGGSGVQRTLKFVKHLPANGWIPIILTVKEDEQIVGVRDHRLLDEVPDEAKIYRTDLIEPYNNIVHRLVMGTRQKHGSASIDEAGSRAPAVRTKIGEILHGLMVPDRMIGWYPFAVKEGCKIIARDKPNVILSTSPVATAHLVALRLSQKFNLPLVTDFRDPWTQYYFSVKRVYPLRQFELWLERKVLSASSCVISLTESCQNSFIELHPQIDRAKFCVIPNGYDEGDFSGLVPHTYEKYTIIFTGIVYQQRPPLEIFRALQLLFQESPKCKDKIQFVFIGRQYPGFIDLISEYDLENNVVVYPYMPHRQCLEHLIGADLCYYNVFSNLAITAKLFDYLRSGIHILAAIPKDHPAAMIIENAKAGTVIPPDNIELLKNTISTRMNNRKETTATDDKMGGTQSIAKFERAYLTRLLVERLNKL